MPIKPTPQPISKPLTLSLPYFIYVSTNTLLPSSILSLENIPRSLLNLNVSLL